MEENTAVTTTQEINFLDEKSKKVIYGLLKSPLARIMLGNAKSKADGVTVKSLHTDEAGIHFALHDSKTQQEKNVVITKQDLEEIIRFVME